MSEQKHNLTPRKALNKAFLKGYQLYDLTEEEIKIVEENKTWKANYSYTAPH